MNELKNKKLLGLLLELDFFDKIEDVNEEKGFLEITWKTFPTEEQMKELNELYKFYMLQKRV